MFDPAPEVTRAERTKMKKCYILEESEVFEARKRLGVLYENYKQCIRCGDGEGANDFRNKWLGAQEVLRILKLIKRGEDNGNF